jgi:hypothetical protein
MLSADSTILAAPWRVSNGSGVCDEGGQVPAGRSHGRDVAKLLDIGSGRVGKLHVQHTEAMFASLLGSLERLGPHQHADRRRVRPSDPVVPAPFHSA